jgi:hypothetical protein
MSTAACDAIYQEAGVVRWFAQCLDQQEADRLKPVLLFDGVHRLGFAIAKPVRTADRA